MVRAPRPPVLVVVGSETHLRGGVPPMSSAEFKVLREQLGLTAPWVAEQRGVAVRTVRNWEDRGPVPIPAAAWLFELRDRFNRAVEDEVFRLAELDDDPRRRVTVVPRIDEDSPDELPASFHRAVAARVLAEVPSARIRYPDVPAPEPDSDEAA